MPHLGTKLAAASFLVLAAGLAAAPANALIINYISNMTTTNEIPQPPNNGAFGTATFVYNDQGNGFSDDDTLSWNINYTEALFPGGISSAHIHFGSSLFNGDIIIDIPSQVNSTPANGLNPPPIIGGTTLTDVLLGVAGSPAPALCGAIPDGVGGFIYTAQAIRQNFLCADGTATVLDPSDPGNNGAAVNIYINLHSNEFPSGFIRDQLNLVAEVPEPGTIMLLGAGVLGLAGLRRRKA